MDEQTQSEDEDERAGSGEKAEAPTCEYDDDCESPAAYVVERFYYPKGTVETAACETHTEEYLEQFSEDRVRPLSAEDSA